MAPRDYSSLRLLVEGRLVDDCQITHDSAGADDDTLDVDTGDLVQPEGDAPAIYEGQCLVYQADRRLPTDASEGEREISSNTYLVRIPSGAPEVPIGSIVVVRSSTWDAQLVGQLLHVLSVQFRSSLVSRDLLTEIRTPVRP